MPLRRCPSAFVAAETQMRAWDDSRFSDLSELCHEAVTNAPSAGSADDKLLDLAGCAKPEEFDMVFFQAQSLLANNVVNVDRVGPQEQRRPLHR
jgi:hypothetical protein